MLLADLLGRVTQVEQRIDFLGNKINDSREAKCENEMTSVHDLNSSSEQYSPPKQRAQPYTTNRNITALNDGPENHYQNAKSGPRSGEMVKRVLWDISPPTKYMDKTPFECEELRSPLPDLLSQDAPTEAQRIIPFVDDFLQYSHMLFPLMCKATAFNVSDVVKREGFRANLHSCLTLLMVALSKAFTSLASTESGLSDFQRANQILSRLNAQLSLEYVQIQLLSALFLLKKSRLISYSIALHTACTSLCTLVRR